MIGLPDAEGEPIPVMLGPLGWENVKQDLQAMVRQVAGMEPA